MFLATSMLRFRTTAAFTTVSTPILRSRLATTTTATASSRLFMSTKAVPKKNKRTKPTKIIPMTLLSGFLGSGKTTTLKHLLENTEGLQLGVIVNDVASVNIDAKLVSSTSSTASTDMVELENGCACCSLADELFTSVETLLIKRQKQKDKQPFDAIVIELSGVADPMAIQSNWKMATAQGQHPVTRRTQIDRVITLVDACTFGSDWMTVDLASAREKEWQIEGDDCAGQRKVTELLAEQVEAAQIVVLNKLDLASPDEAKIATAVAAGINPDAIVERVEFGKMTPQLLLGPLKKKKTEEKKKKKKEKNEESHSHSHHDHAAGAGAKDEKETSCADPDCTDTSHSHSHSHNKDDDEEEANCADPDCTDTTHSHSHSHASTSTTEELDIINFVYKRDIPFNTVRLLTLLNFWPIPIKENLSLDDFAIVAGQQQQEETAVVETKQSNSKKKATTTTKEKNPFDGVLRSKGFCWMAPSRWLGPNDDAFRHDTAMYWSHAGKHLGVTAAGKWWGTISEEQMASYFTQNPEELERIRAQDFVSDEWKDRRQELVFIGSGISEQAITDALDKCLLGQGEMEQYRENAANHRQLLQNLAEQSLELRDTQSRGLFGDSDQYDPNYPS